VTQDEAFAADADAERQNAEHQKKVAGDDAALLVEDGMTVGLGTGSTVAYLLPALAARHLDVRCVATSLATEIEGRRLGLEILEFERIGRLDLAIDGADQVTPDRWLVKGGGGAHTREKIVAAAADRFVVIVSQEKLVEGLTPPIPLELHHFGLAATIRNLADLGEVRLRPNAPPSPDGGVIADLFGDVGDPVGLSARLAATPGVVDHGLFSPAMVTEVIVGGR
jgi:ribose 5-phosphate isomerase A